MNSAIGSAVYLVAYLALFAGVGIVFLFVNLLVGKFVRPHNPEPEKLEIYECGEPTIGSSFVQFDLRFYVIALLFIIFDVEVAFFFPWAAVFGKSTTMMDNNVAIVDANGAMTADAKGMYEELGVQNPTLPTVVPPSLKGSVAENNSQAIADGVTHQGFKQLAWVTVVDIGAFFAILLIGFAYVWKRGDLDWVRALSQERGAARGRKITYDPLEEEQFLSA